MFTFALSLTFSSYCISSNVYVNKNNIYNQETNNKSVSNENIYAKEKRIEYKDTTVEKNLNVNKFTSIDVCLPAIVSIKQGEFQQVIIKAKQDVIDKIKIRVSNGVLKIEFKKGIDNYRYINLEITVPTIQNIKIVSAAKVSMSSFKGLENLNITLKGAGIFKATENMTLMGTLHIMNSGVGLINCYKISTKKCKVILSGVGKCDVRSEFELEVEINGVGVVNYKGHPEKIYKDINGLGTLNNQN